MMSVPTDRNQLADLLATYTLRYVDPYHLMDVYGDYAPTERVQEDSLDLILTDPDGALEYVESELDDWSDGPMDGMQIDMLIGLREGLMACRS